MDYKIIFEEYTKASNKVKYIKEKAKTLGVYDSDIICELFKSGYKFEELKRANKATYNAGMKKYEKWKENGSPEDEEADALERTEPEQTQPAPSTRVDEENYKPEDYIAHLEKVLKEQEEKITELISTNQYLEDNNKIYMDENCQLKADLSQSKCAYDEMLKNYNDAMLMNKQLESQFALEKAEDSEVMAEHIKANKRMMERIDELQVELNEATQNYNEAMIMYQKLEKDSAVDSAGLETTHRILADEYRKNDELTKKLETAERYILDKIYADYEKEKNTNAG